MGIGDGGASPLPANRRGRRAASVGELPSNLKPGTGVRDGDGDGDGDRGVRAEHAAGDSGSGGAPALVFGLSQCGQPPVGN